jgi:hypothetical protein
MTSTVSPALLLLDLQAAVAAFGAAVRTPARHLVEALRSRWWSTGHYATRVRWFAWRAGWVRNRGMASRAVVGRHTCASLVGDLPAHDHARTWARKTALDRAMYHRNPVLHAQLQHCADRLSEVVEAHRRTGPVVLAPLHMVSDVLATTVCAMLPGRRVSVAAVHVPGALGPAEQAAMTACGFAIEPLDVCDKATMRATLPGVLRAVRRAEHHLAIFPDILPEFTTAAAGRAMRTKSVHMFGRAGRMHCGLDDLAGALKATALVFHLVEDGNALDIRIHAVPHDAIAARVPRIIEDALRAHPHAWLLWHYGSAFYYNAGPA